MNKKKSVFRGRVLPALLIVAVSLLTFCIGDGWPFRILFCVICVLALIELISLTYRAIGGVSEKRARWYRGFCCLLVLGGELYVLNASQTEIALLFFCVWGADAAGWVGGRAFGKKFIPKTPFDISPNKTWEGTIAHLVSPALFFMILWGLRCLVGHPILGIVDVGIEYWYFMLVGPLALWGDLMGSRVKRAYHTKNSCDHAALQYNFFVKIKEVLGDHGGCFDRIDSIVFTGTVLLILGWICMLVFKV